MREKFRDIKLSKANKVRLDMINDIIREYQRQGLIMSLRQLYYQLVSRDVIPNIQSEYAKLSKLLKEGRMSGVVDWDAIEDRLRRPSIPSSWSSPSEILSAVANQFTYNLMASQEKYVEVWVEKDALSGVLSRVTRKYHVPLLVNRGYSSVSAMKDSFDRFIENGHREGRPVEILYLGDFDPSGVDMIRDIRSRIAEFAHGHFEVEERYDLSINWGKESEDDDVEDCLRYLAGDDVFDFKITPIALTWDQIQRFNPPPNPAKIQDPRAKQFIAERGHHSYEVDALRPEVLNDIVEKSIRSRISVSLYEGHVERSRKERERLKEFAQNWKESTD